MKPSPKCVLVIGDVGVGKTNIVNRFNGEEFSEIHKNKKPETDDKSILFDLNGTHFQFKIYGIPAQERFLNIKYKLDF
jgi:GTPase SAR1 family protein